MKQIQFIYRGDSDLAARLTEAAARSAGSSHMLFHVFSTAIDQQKLLHIRDMIAAACPSADIVGATTNGNIAEGLLSSDDILITCSIFEDPGTRLETLHYALSGANENETAEALVQAVNDRPWVTGVELLLMIRGMSMTHFCRKMAGMREDVRIFGGGCFANDIYDNEAIALEKESGCSDHLVVVLYGGPALQIRTDLVTGWKPLGQSLLVTRADESGRVYELDRKPAYDIYNHYLHIPNDAHFFENTLEFPFLYNNNGVMLLRAPIACYPDGSLQMTSDMEQGGTARIAFGDPKAIYQNVNDVGVQVEDFHPEAILIFSCAARKTFWGEDTCSRETLPFNDLAPTSGFYTSGEFIRQNGELQQHNVSLVITSFREEEDGTSALAGDGAGMIPGNAADRETDSTGKPLKAHRFHISGWRNDGQVSVIARLANFVEAATSELEETNRKLEETNGQLEDANKLLAQQSITDGLTGLLNRKEIQSRITEEAERLAAVAEHAPHLRRRSDMTSLIMIDLDFFKKVNDIWGHKEGDNVLAALADTLRKVTKRVNPEASIGRWGGEEFMILLPGNDAAAAAALAEQLRSEYASLRFPAADPQTMSLGVTQIIPGENADAAASRADDALYQAKNHGRNRVQVL